MKKNFLDMKSNLPIPSALGFADGFKFGFGMFTAGILGLSIVAAISFGVLKALHLI